MFEFNLFATAPSSNTKVNTIEQEVIKLGEEQVVYQIKRSHRRKTLTLTIDKRGLIAHAPIRLAQNRIGDFILQKADWIIPRIKEFKNISPVDYSQIYIYGQYFQICKITGEVNQKNGDIDYINKKLWISETANIKIEVQKILIDIAKNEITKRLPYFVGRMNLGSPRFKISKAESRWGSCSVSGELSFSWKLACVYPMLIDYVIVHELAHHTHMNHSPRFWALVGKHFPAYKLARNNLREFELKLANY